MRRLERAAQARAERSLREAQFALAAVNVIAAARELVEHPGLNRELKLRKALAKWDDLGGQDGSQD